MSTPPINPQPSQPAQSAVPRFGRMDLGMDRVESGIARTVDWFWSKQHEQGFWVGELEADSMLEADYIFMHTLLGTGDRGKMERCINEILRHQNEDGGWSLYPGGPSNVNYGVKCYFALKLMGWNADHPVLKKARENVLALGDLFLLPSAHESFGLSALEAMSCGLPVIATEIGGLAEVVTPGVDGWLCHVGDCQCMADHAHVLLNNGGIRESFGAAARSKAVTKFSPEKLVPQYEAVYRRMLNK